MPALEFSLARLEEAYINLWHGNEHPDKAECGTWVYNRIVSEFVQRGEYFCGKYNGADLVMRSDLPTGRVCLINTRRPDDETYNGVIDFVAPYTPEFPDVDLGFIYSDGTRLFILISRESFNRVWNALPAILRVSDSGSVFGRAAHMTFRLGNIYFVCTDSAGKTRAWADSHSGLARVTWTKEN